VNERDATDRIVEIMNHGWLVLVLSLGERLGLHELLAGRGATTFADLAAEAGCDERALREWALAMAAAELVDVTDTTVALRPEYTRALTSAGGADHWSRICVQIAGVARMEDLVVDSMRTGDGLPATAYEGYFTELMSIESGPIFRQVLLDEVVPMLGVGELLLAGAAVADLGCGRGDALLILAEAFPASTFIGIDESASAIEAATASARERGLGNVAFRVADVEEDLGLHDLDIAMAANVVHDLADPGAFYARVAGALRPGGVLYVHELDSSDDMAENLADPHALGKLGFSLYHCIPLASRRDGVVPGAFFGRGRHLALLEQAGFAVERRYAPSDPVNLTLVARTSGAA
jgi:SAM-dependent methyltransferase